MVLFFTKSVAVKMLPFDNKNEFQVVIDMPEGTTLERTGVVAQEISQYLSTRPEVVNYQNYIGTSAPIKFNGLVLHYDLRGGSNMADIQVNLLVKEKRSAQSHDIAKLLRPDIQNIASKYNANVKLVEVPPGPPVLSTIVAEVYGPDYDEQIRIANSIQNILTNTTDVVDIDWMVEADQAEYLLEIDKEKAMLYGIAPQQIAYTMNMALSNKAITNLYDENASNQVGLVLTLDEKEKSTITDIAQLKIKSKQGSMVPIADLVSISQNISAKSIYRKNQTSVVYVMADRAGELGSPAYAI